MLSIVAIIVLSFNVHFKEDPPASPFVHDTDETRASEQVSISPITFFSDFYKKLGHFVKWM
jgi:hypothetical protein